MAKQWKSWTEQGKLKTAIRSLLDTSCDREAVVWKVTACFKDEKGQPWTSEAVGRGIDELIADWFVIVRNDGWLQLTEESHDSLVKATGQGDYPGALMFLMDRGVWHPDMERFGMTEGGKDAATVMQDEHGVVKINTMPDSEKVKRIEKAQGESANLTEVPEGAERVGSALQTSYDATFAKDEKHEFSIAEIIEKTPGIDSSEMAVEIGDWISSNVEQFIDNRETVFRMYLNIKDNMGMPVSSLFQRLYLSVPDVDDTKGITGALVDSMYDALDAKLVETKELLSCDKDFLTYLFTRMAFFYEITGFVVVDGRVKQALTQEMAGKIKINELVFDPISLTTTVAQGVGKHEKGIIREGDSKVVIKREEMPAAFGIEIEIAISPKNDFRSAMY